MPQRIICSLRFSLALALLLPAADCHHAELIKEQPRVKLEVSSFAFKEGESIPVKHSCDGDDLSPGLTWSGAPKNTTSLALICDDPDAPAGTWVHWVLYDLQPTTTSLPEGIASSWPGATQGTNDFKRIGYGGPCPPPGKSHRYFFKLYALDAKLDLKPGATKSELVSAMNGHILAEGRLMGTYRRN